MTLDPLSHSVVGTLHTGGLPKAAAVWWPAVQSGRLESDLNSINYAWRFPGSSKAVAVAAALGAGASLSPVNQPCVALPGHIPEPQTPGDVGTSGTGLDGSAAATAATKTAAATDVAAADQIRFSISIPQRFGPFGWVDGQMTMLGSWYPLTTQSQPACTPDAVLAPLRTARVRVTATSAGVLVLGTNVAMVRAGGHLETTADLSQPLLLAFLPRHSALKVRSPSGTGLEAPPGDSGTTRPNNGGEVTATPGGSTAPSTGGEVPTAHASGTPAAQGDLLAVTTAQPGSAAFEALLQAARLAASFQATTANLPKPAARSHPRQEGSLVLLQAPLREMMVLPFEGGLLVSDRLFRSTRLGPLNDRHIAAATWGLLGQRLLQQGCPYRDALVLAALQQSLGSTSGGPGSTLSKWFRKGEVLAVIDQIGTDPQTGFQQGLFGMAVLPDELARIPWNGAAQPASPWVVAHQIRSALGDSRIQELMAQVPEIPKILPRIRQLLDDNMPGLGTGLFEPHTVDVKLRSVGAGQLNLDATPGDNALAIQYRVRSSNQLGSGVCARFPCTLAVPGVGADSDILLDPFELLAQSSPAPQDPRLDDRNYLDLKWMLSKAAFSYSSSDSLPFAQVELALQPRYDLSNMAFLTPFVGPVRSGMLGGYRWGLGRRNRANARSWYIAAGPRVALDSQSPDSYTAGVMTSLLYSSYLSRTNPFDGSMIYLYALPYLHSPSKQFGLRTGGFATRLFGTTPDHILAARLSLDTSVGELPQHEQAYSGGSEGVRALSTQGTGRRHRVSVSLEYRLMLVRNLWASLAGLAWLEGIQAVVFVDSAQLSNSVSGLFETESSVLGAGLGIRPHVQLFGFVPATMAVDAAWLFPVGSITKGGLSILFGFTQAF